MSAFQEFSSVVQTPNASRQPWHAVASFVAIANKRPGIKFYTLRHTFRTWADEIHDQIAIHRIMGHSLPSMSGNYVEEISLDRLRRVVYYVRGRLWG